MAKQFKASDQVASDPWVQFAVALRGQVDLPDFDAHLAHVLCESISGSAVRLLAPNDYTRERIRRMFSSPLREAARAVIGGEGLVEIALVDDEQEQDNLHILLSLGEVLVRGVNCWGVWSESQGEEALTANQCSYPRGATARPEQLQADLILNDDFTFHNYVVGACNKLAYEAARALTDQRARHYSPLFVYGSPGLGKTHLLQAVCHELRSRQVRKRIVYLSSETFVNRFIQAITDGELDRFRQRMRRVDLLVIDDIQFLEGKAKAQEEFFHTFNSLIQTSGQVALSCDRPPHEVAMLHERLVSRFRAGMVTKISEPDFVTRLEVIFRKGERRGVTVGREVAEMIACSAGENTRELEGAVTMVLNYAELMQREVSVTLVRDVLRHLLPDSPRVNMRGILTEVREEFGLLSGQLESKSRAKSVVLPRQLAMYLARTLTSLSLEEIGRHLGGRDFSTVHHGIRKIQSRSESDPIMEQRLRRLTERILSRHGVREAQSQESAPSGRPRRLFHSHASQKVLKGCESQFFAEEVERHP